MRKFPLILVSFLLVFLISLSFSSALIVYPVHDVTIVESGWEWYTVFDDYGIYTLEDNFTVVSPTYNGVRLGVVCNITSGAGTQGFHAGYGESNEYYDSAHLISVGLWDDGSGHLYTFCEWGTTGGSNLTVDLPFNEVLYLSFCVNLDTNWIYIYSGDDVISSWFMGSPPVMDSYYCNYVRIDWQNFNVTNCIYSVEFDYIDWDHDPTPTPVSLTRSPTPTPDDENTLPMFFFLFLLIGSLLAVMLSLFKFLETSNDKMYRLLFVIISLVMFGLVMVFVSPYLGYLG